MTITPHRTDRSLGTVLSDGTDTRLPTGWLRATGRVPDVLAAWERDALAEVPTGIAWDVVRVPAVTVQETLRLLTAARAPIGPVIATPFGAEFFVSLGSADGWTVPGASLLPRGRLALLPHPRSADPCRVSDRCWLVRPDDRTLTWGADLRDAYAEALANLPEDSAG
ncbi:hypothetical protein CUT44_29695 [Streptomyces carminius]|uniref:DNA primase/polymerase bifunctional N-terminal domain-containing protein n=1 Tax=Streptomyces carminius TaxID=2665496 RepID=A0A2M8LR43_9ACTN|nr:hypothetical protein [Streptomyces carminius]PJE94409.1 hypothetical protein CUT44_29695 [Streptomyces carminius]